MRRLLLSILALVALAPSAHAQAFRGAPRPHRSGISTALSAAATVTCDAAATTAIAAMTTPPDTRHQNAYCTLISSLEASGVWAKLDYLVLGATHSPQSSRVNLITGSVCAEAGTGAITYTTDVGMATDGARYLNCGSLSPVATAHYQQDSASAGVIFSSATNGTRVGTDTAIMRLQQTAATSVQTRLNGTAAPSLTMATSSTGWRHAAISRTSSTGFTIWGHNTVNDTTATSTATDTSNVSGSGVTLYIFRNSSATSGAGVDIKAMYSGGGITSADFEAIHTALTTYLSTLGAI